jgi:methionine-rich copper-binding protein CopC
MEIHTRTRKRIATVTVMAAIVAGIGLGTVVSAHDEIASSIPADRSQFDEPISDVTIDFGMPVDGIELALIDPDDNELPGTVTKLSDTTARLDFELLSQEGQYIVRYLAEEDGHLVAGAISFVYGSQGGTGASATTWIAYGVLAAVILAIGMFFTLRRRAQLDDELVEA